ncbi:hypothetical protein EVAR_2833_1 [Eumeta japonica]|uniref:Uncharacterized protein n=1 Tax=Eumeta variegata TaxID=151549 RepID=A0A4C1T0S9_EUMVA|nr:hypothetical protein EVAR_2833_1 [Eumeta japonica]
MMRPHVWTLQVAVCRRRRISLMVARGRRGRAASEERARRGPPPQHAAPARALDTHRRRPHHHYGIGEEEGKVGDRWTCTLQRPKAIQRGRVSSDMKNLAQLLAVPVSDHVAPLTTPVAAATLLSRTTGEPGTAEDFHNVKSWATCMQPTAARDPDQIVSPRYNV